ncbi:MAG: glycosyltransferase family 2 protein [Candidatus Buchananbacteria bacterium]
MDLSIITLTNNERGLLKYFLRSLAEHPPKHSFEVIVVDNGSSDGSKKLLQELTAATRNSLLPQPLPLKVIYHDKNYGYVKGNNAGLKQAQGKYVVLFNVDIFLFDNSIDQLYDYLEANPQVGLVAPHLLNPDHTVQNSVFKFPNLLIPPYRRTILGKTPWGKKALAKYNLLQPNSIKPYPVDWTMSSAVMIRKSCLEKIGLIDERFFLYFQEIDLCRRLWENGFAVMIYPLAKFIHLHRRESADSFGLLSLKQRYTRIHIIDWLKYLGKYGKTVKPTSQFYRQNINPN